MLKNSKLALLALALFGSVHLAKAQTDQPVPCGFNKYNEELMRQNPDYAGQVKKHLERITTISGQAGQNKLQQTTKVIPMVIHIIHDYAGSNISRAQVMDAVRMINEDFRRLNADTTDVVQPFKQLVADSQLEFRLAKLDPNGNCTDGITRTYSPLTADASDAVKDLIRWDPNRYLNIWVVKYIEGAGGYAYYPCAPWTVDGILVRNTQFGSIGTSSPTSLPRSLTHEIGHYLGLPHTWGSTNEPGLLANCATDDGIFDTPNTVGVTGLGCNTNMTSCGNLNNVQNVMDYASCQKMFTHGQRDAMHDALALSCRTNLWSQTNLAATGTSDGYIASACLPKADFATVITQICTGTTVTFQDMSYNAAVDSTWSWSWSFPGGTPSVSTAQNPQVLYATEGTYPVTLTVTNAGGSNSRTRTAYMEVKETNTGLIAPLAESFESSTFPAVPANPVQSWTQQNESTSTWERTNVAADGASSMRIRHTYIPSDRVNSLVSPNIDLSAMGQRYVTFKVAYAPKPGQSNPDKLRVLISTDCGRTWLLRYSKSGTALATASAVSGLYVPASGEWREESFLLPINVPRVMLKFESTSGNGNTLYLDAINIRSSLVGTEEEAVRSSLQVYPNPNTGQATIRYSTLEAGETELQIRDMLGRQVGSISQAEEAGEHELQLHSVAGKLSSGVYFLQLKTGSIQAVQKLVVH